MDQENKNQNDSVFSRKIRAGRRRTYFFDVKTTKANDYYLTITESKKRMDNNGYERHKVFIYKEDFNKFLAEMTESINYIKSRMPDFDFDSFSHEYEQDDKHSDYNEKTKHSSDKSTTHTMKETPETESKQEETKEDNTPPENTPDQDNHEDLKW